MRLAPKLLWIDSSAALLAGGLVLALSGWLSKLHALPGGLLVLTGGVNLLYGSYSFSLAVRAQRPRVLITVLVVANLSWAAVCLGLYGSLAFDTPSGPSIVVAALLLFLASLVRLPGRG